jgi:hypothetical protein
MPRYHYTMKDAARYDDPDGTEMPARDYAIRIIREVHHSTKARHLRPGLKVLLTSGYVADQATDHGIGWKCRFSISRTDEMSSPARCELFWAEAPRIKCNV